MSIVFFPTDRVVLIALSDGNYLNVSISSSAKLILVAAAMNSMLRKILKLLVRALWSSVAMGMMGKSKDGILATNYLSLYESVRKRIILN